jgi:hypothetical protein
MSRIRRAPDSPIESVKKRAKMKGAKEMKYIEVRQVLSGAPKELL